MAKGNSEFSEMYLQKSTLPHETNVFLSKPLTEIINE